MVPLVRSSCETLVEILGECAGTDKSVDVFRYISVCDGTIDTEGAYVCVTSHLRERVSLKFMIMACLSQHTCSLSI